MKRCAAQHFGLWLVHDVWFAQALASYRNGDLARMAADGEFDDDGDGADPFMMGPNGMMIIPIVGHMMKSVGSFGGVSSVNVRRTLRNASTDDGVSGVLLHVDSPGGTAAGTFELAAEVKRFAEVKPIRTHIEDLGASAAFWVASQTQSISINQLGQAGSIGTVAVLIDSSEAAESQGLKVHVISTGEFKGAGVPGTPITERQLALFQEEVDDVNGHFLEAVGRGRGIHGSSLSAIASGRVWIADKALALGLVDKIMSFEDAIASFAEDLKPESSGSGGFGSRIAMAQLELEL